MRGWTVAIGVGIMLWLAHVAIAIWQAPATKPGVLEVAINPTDLRHSILLSGDPKRIEFRIDGRPDHGEPLVSGFRLFRWSEHYRGGFERSVATSQRIGPRQTNQAPVCGIRMRVHQRMLDDGDPTHPTIANLVKQQLGSELKNLSAWPIGHFIDVTQVHLRWTENNKAPPDGTVFGIPLARAARQLILLQLELRFSRANVPLTIGLIPELIDGKLRLRTYVNADVVGNNRVYRFVLDALGGDARATQIISSELSHALVELLAPPPPLVFANDYSISLRYCPNQPLVIRDGHYAELPLDVELIHRGKRFPPGRFTPAEASALLPTNDRASHTDANANTMLELDIDTNGLAALVHQMWGNGFLHNVFDSLALADRFNNHPTVVQLLSIRIRDLELAGPPVLEPLRDSDGNFIQGTFSIATELKLTIVDGGNAVDGGNVNEDNASSPVLATPAHLFARLQFTLANDGHHLIETASVTDVSLTCLGPTGRLRSCYDLIGSQLRSYAPQIAKVVVKQLELSFASLFVDRKLAIAELGAMFRVDTSQSAPLANGLRISLTGQLSTTE